MLIALAWVTEGGGDNHSALSRAALHRRVKAFLRGRVPAEWRVEIVEGRDWGVVVAAARPGRWRWDMAARDGGVLTVSIGLPLGLDPDLLAGGPSAVGRAAIDQMPVFDGVIPPFGIIATDGERLVAQQDWFGMAPLYQHRSGGVVAISNRPLLLPFVFANAIRPDPEGWARYVACDAFVGSTSPVAGVKPLGPGEALVAEVGRDRRGVSISRHRQVDDVARTAAELAHRDLDGSVLSGIARATSGLAALWDGPPRCGLSGGRDSRLLAASLIANDLRPQFYTNTENPQEGATAVRLMNLATARRGITYSHDLIPPRHAADGASPSGGTRGLRSLFLDFDFSFRRQYVLRGSAPRPNRLPDAAINGGLGGLAWGTWVPDTWVLQSGNPPDDVVRALHRGLASKAGGPLSAEASAYLDHYVAELLARATQLGLNQVQALTWMYCVSRGRSWVTARQSFHQMLLYATSEFISASIALPLDHKRGSRLHRRLTERLVPEWTGVEYVRGGGVPPKEQPHIWDGHGQAVLDELAASTTGDLTRLLDAGAVHRALGEVRAGQVDERSIPKHNRLLLTFAVLASAEQELRSLDSQLAAFGAQELAVGAPPAGAGLGSVTASAGPGTVAGYSGSFAQWVVD